MERLTLLDYFVEFILLLKIIIIIGAILISLVSVYIFSVEILRKIAEKSASQFALVELKKMRGEDIDDIILKEYSLYEKAEIKFEENVLIKLKNTGKKNITTLSLCVIYSTESQDESKNTCFLNFEESEIKVYQPINKFSVKPSEEAEFLISPWSSNIERIYVYYFIPSIGMFGQDIYIDRSGSGYITPPVMSRVK